MSIDPARAYNRFEIFKNRILLASKPNQKAAEVTLIVNRPEARLDVHVNAERVAYLKEGGTQHGPSLFPLEEAEPIRVQHWEQFSTLINALRQGFSLDEGIAALRYRLQHDT